MLGSVDALEPGFRPGARWGLGSPEHGGRRTHQVFVPAHAGGGLARRGLWHALVGSGTLGGLARAGGARRVLGALAHAGGSGALGGSVFPDD